MKRLIILLMFFACTSSSQISQEPVLVMITPVEEGFEIYSESGELLLEFTAQDSADVELLEFIHGVVLDFKQNPEHWKNKDYQPKQQNKKIDVATLSSNR